MKAVTFALVALLASFGFASTAQAIDPIPQCFTNCVPEPVCIEDRGCLVSAYCVVRLCYPPTVCVRNACFPLLP